MGQMRIVYAIGRGAQFDRSHLPASAEAGPFASSAVSERDIERARAVACALEDWGTAREWTGTDPYDGLNARAPFARMLRGSALGARALTQAVKRCPIDIRPMLGVPGGQSAMTLALLVSAYARNGFLGEDHARERLRWAMERLQVLRCAGFEQPCWGYHFDVQTRFFFYPRSAPNTIATAAAGLGLLDAYELAGEHSALELARGAGEFFLRHVPQTKAGGGGAYFGYLVGDRTPIHNANMLVCALLARLARHVKPPDRLRAAAAAGVQYTLARQRPDGSWPYAENPEGDWVDSFHTGYVLDCLLACGQASAGAEAERAWERGVRFYAREMLLGDGTPKYTPTSVYPVDGLCAAQAIQTLALASRRLPDLTDRAWAVFDYTMRRGSRSDGAFVFQRRRHWVNRTPHPRWVQAPMLAALTHLVGG